MLLDLLFPKFCLNCHYLGSYICTSCQKLITRHKQICIVCKKPSLFGLTHSHCQPYTSLDGIIIACEYKSLIKKAMHHIKYKLTYDILTELLEKTLSSAKIHTFLTSNHIDIITAIPSHHTKRNSRGFNQSYLIARWLSHHFNIPHQQLLQKTRKTDSQMHLKKYDRIFNLQEAFTLSVPPQDIENKTILIADDITTTGTTLEECAKILKSNNALKIWGLTIASGK